MPCSGNNPKEAVTADLQEADAEAQQPFRKSMQRFHSMSVSRAPNDAKAHAEGELAKESHHPALASAFSPPPVQPASTSGPALPQDPKRDDRGPSYVLHSRNYGSFIGELEKDSALYSFLSSHPPPIMAPVAQTSAGPVPDLNEFSDDMLR